MWLSAQFQDGSVRDGWSKDGAEGTWSTDGFARRREAGVRLRAWLVSYMYIWPGEAEHKLKDVPAHKGFDRYSRLPGLRVLVYKRMISSTMSDPTKEIYKRSLRKRCALLTRVLHNVINPWFITVV